jgi:hypothetical protein
MQTSCRLKIPRQKVKAKQRKKLTEIHLMVQKEMHLKKLFRKTERMMQELYRNQLLRLIPVRAKHM